MHRGVMRAILAAFVPLILAGCSGGSRTVVVTAPPPPRPVSILVEVYDPATNFVWENVGVRVVEVDHEWSGCTCANPVVEWFLTDSTGQVLIDEFVLAASAVGFVEDHRGGAVIGSRSFEDQATVLLEIDALGFTPVLVEVPLSWDVPDVFVSVPFN